MSIMRYRFGMNIINVFGLMFVIIFVIVVGTFFVTAVKGIRQWNKNNNSPSLTVPATVVSKRTHVSHRNGVNDNYPYTFTTYYVTFQVASGDRIEFQVTGHEYGMLADGDNGLLSFQGTRYLGLKRQ